MEKRANPEEGCGSHDRPGVPTCLHACKERHERDMPFASYLLPGSYGLPAVHAPAYRFVDDGPVVCRRRVREELTVSSPGTPGVFRESGWQGSHPLPRDAARWAWAAPLCTGGWGPGTSWDEKRHLLRAPSNCKTSQHKTLVAGPPCPATWRHFNTTL